MEDESAREPALDAASFDAFLLGMRVVLHAYELDPPATQFERPWQLLREIADARGTLTNPADTAARFPGLSEFLYDRAADVHAHDRAVAQRILRGLGTAFEDESR